MTVELTVGVDVGNNSVKVYGSGESFCFPTVVDTLAQLNIWESHNDPMQQLDLEILGSKSAPVGRAFFGPLAVSTKNGTAMPSRSNKAKSSQVYQSLLCALAIAAARKLDGLPLARYRTFGPRGPITVEVNLGTGLPMATWLHEEDRKAFRLAIRGIHRVQWVSTPQWNSYGEICIVIKDVLVAPEGTAVLYGKCYAEDGKTLRDGRLAEGNVLVNDIGANTHDMPYYRQMHLDNALSRPYDSHLSEQIDAIADQVNLELGRNLSRPALEQYLFQQDMSIPNGTLPSVSIRHIAEPRFKQLAAEYAVRIKNRFEASNGELTDVLMAGGGSAVVRPYLEEALFAQGLPCPLPFRLIWAGDAQYGNAVGYYKLIRARLARAHSALR